MNWIAQLKLPSGWCFYRFEVDGKTQWDRAAAAKMKNPRWPSVQPGLDLNFAQSGVVQD